MAYYFVLNKDFYTDYMLNTTQIFWVGDHAASIFLNGNGQDTKLLKHTLVVFDRISDFANKPTHLEKTVIVRENFPLWEDDYNNAKLERAFSSISDKLFPFAKVPVIIVGDPGELFVQTYLRFLIKSFFNDKLNEIYEEKHSDASVILLKDKHLFKDILIEIENLKPELNKWFSFAIEVEPDDFEWNTFVKTNTEIFAIKENKKTVLTKVFELINEH